MRGEIPVCKEISMEMNRIDDLIRNPGIYYNNKAMDGAAVTLSGEGAIEGQIGLQAGTNVAVTLDGGSITATKMGIQATPEDSSTTEIIAHAGTITSENVSIYAKKLTLDPAEGKTITLEGKLSLTENAVLATGTKVTINGEEATGLKRTEGTILVTK